MMILATVTVLLGVVIHRIECNVVLLKKVTRQNSTGQNGMDKMVRTEW